VNGLRELDRQLVSRLAALEKRFDGLQIPEKSLLLAAPFLQLPMLRGLWVSSVDSNGDWFDLSGLGKTLSYQGNPMHYYSGLVPYWAYDGAGDYHARTDEADLDITGTETYVGAVEKGLTMHVWCYPTTANFEQITGKWLAGGNQRSYRIVNNSGTWLAQVSDDGTATTNRAGAAATTGQWWHLVERFDPSTTLDFWNNGVKYSVATAGVASIFNGNADFRVAADGAGGSLLTGNVAAVALYAAAHSDAMISSMWQQTRALFGV
jgi:hypothetical protein